MVGWKIYLMHIISWSSFCLTIFNCYLCLYKIHVNLCYGNFIICILFENMLDSIHGYWIAMNLYVSMLSIFNIFFLFTDMNALYMVLLLFGRFTLLISWGNFLGRK